MKIEKLNENQIRCTLTTADLVERQLKLSELAFGTEKAKLFFQDMMEQAMEEFGFDVQNIPIMIEAVPTSPDSIVLIITKVEDPGMLENRMASVGQNIPQMGSPAHSLLPDGPVSLNEDENSNVMGNNDVKIFAFQSMDIIIRAAKALKGLYKGRNALYKDIDSNDYYLVISQNRDEDKEAFSFKRVCHMLTEYGVPNMTTPATLAYLGEHCRSIQDVYALQVLAEL